MHGQYPNQKGAPVRLSDPERHPQVPLYTWHCTGCGSSQALSGAALTQECARVHAEICRDGMPQ